MPECDSVSDGRNISMEERATPNTAAMATTSTWRWRGDCSNGIALLLYWFDTHRRTYARTAQIISLPFSTQSLRQSTQGIIPRFISALCPPERAALDPIIRQANYSCANMHTPSSCIYIYIHAENTRLYGTQCMHDPVSVRCIAGCSLVLSLPLVFCLFSSSILSLSLPLWNPLFFVVTVVVTV